MRTTYSPPDYYWNQLRRAEQACHDSGEHSGWFNMTATKQWIGGVALEHPSLVQYTGHRNILPVWQRVADATLSIRNDTQDDFVSLRLWPGWEALKIVRFREGESELNLLRRGKAHTAEDYNLILEEFRRGATGAYDLK